MNQNLHVTDLLPAYALGALEETEAQQVRRHLSRCEKCLRELEGLNQVEGSLGLVVPYASPAPDLKARLM